MANLIPGATVLGRGFNIFGDYSNTSLLAPLFDTTTPEGTVTIGVQTYDVGNNTLVDKTSQTTGQAYSFSTRHQYEQHFATKAKIKGSYGALSGSFSAAFSQDSTSESEYSYGLFEADIQKWGLSLRDPSASKLSPSVTTDPTFKDVPTTYKKENEYLFFRFFQKYGTHFVSTVPVGGRIYYTVATQKSFTTNQMEIDAKLSLEYKAVFFSVGGSVKTNWKSAGKDWYDSRRVNILTTGGNSKLINSIIPSFDQGYNSLYESWVNSLDLEPSAINYSLQPVSTLFPGNQGDAVAEAYLAYGNNHLLTESRFDFNSIVLSGKPINAPNIPPVNATYNYPTMTANDPPITASLMHVVVFNRSTLEPVLNKAYAPAPSVYDNETQDIYQDVKPYEGDTNYMIAITTNTYFGYTFPKPEFYQFLQNSGAGGGLQKWENSYNYETEWHTNLINYTLIGVCGAGPGTGIDAITHVVPGKNPSEAPPAKLAVFLRPAHVEEDKVIYQPVEG
jgi:hypothetical protein